MMEEVPDHESPSSIEQGLDSRSPPTFKGKLEQFGFVTSPSKSPRSQNTVSKTESPTTKQPPNMLKRKSSDLMPLVSPGSKRIATSSPRRSRSTSSRRTSSKSHTSPEKYANHPNLLVDSIPPNMHLLFIGLNPGLTTALTGHAYAHPTNHFWRLLHSSGITPILHKPSDTQLLPSLYNYGNTNIVSRPTKDGSELSKAEMDAGVAILEQKIGDKRPEVVCIVGKSIWEAIWRVKKGKTIRKEQFKYGWQDESENMGVVKGPGGWRGARVFVCTTTSGLAATMKKEEKERVWRELGIWAEGKRKSDEKNKKKEELEDADVEATSSVDN